MQFLNEIRILIQSTGIKHFPIGLKELKQIIKKSGWEIYSYSDAEEIIENYNLYDMASKNDSFTANVGNRVVIFYNDNISQLNFPHILGHEIGHIVLGHLNSGDDIYSKERDCEIFSKELLNYSPRYHIAPAFMFSITGVFLLITMIISSIQMNNTNNITIHTPDNSSNTTSNSLIIDENSDNANSELNSVDTSQSLQNETTIVYVTHTGKKYHLSGCWYIKDKNNLIEISIEEAEAAGYEPCKVCFERNDN